MKDRTYLRIISMFLLGCAFATASATTWYVRKDGGTRYSTNFTTGQCDGKTDSAYRGSGLNQHCAFNDVRMLWQDGTYSNGRTFPGWGWVIAGGDTVIVRGSIGTKASYRVGWNSNANSCAGTLCWGIPGDPYGSGAPSPPSGTAENHTRILGENYASCHGGSAKTQIHGGWAIYSVFDLRGASYVDLACLDITDFSACGKATQKIACGTGQDFAQIGIMFSNKSTYDTLTDVHIHGMAGTGIFGPTGNGVVLDYVDILGNAGSGWDTDSGDGTGSGSLLVKHYNISWNGCAEEYPIVDPLPYGDCTDQDHGGYGDGFGTATKDSPPPGWQVHFDEGTVSYNTQDGLDALHIGGAGSSMTVTHTTSFSNMGQQIKVGGSTATITDSYIVGNCSAMSGAIPGTPVGYNDRLGLFCRAGDTAISIQVPTAQPAIFQRNIIYSNNHVALEIEYPDKSVPDAAIKYDNNIFIGFPDSEGDNPSPIYSNTDLKMLTNAGASFSHNVTYRPRGNWKCPATSLHETNGSCADPHLKDETWHKYGFGDSTRTSSPVANVSPSPDTGDRVSAPRSPYMSVAAGSLGVAALVAGAWRGWLHLRGRGSKS